MNSNCSRFRSQLESVLKEPRGGANLGELGWHEHLLGCGACRRLLEAEEALEVLLDSLPRPQLPPELARRVLARLERAPEHSSPARDALDRLLDLDGSANAPAGLSERVLAKLSRQRGDAELDRLLERVPAPQIPVGLAARVTRALERDRARRAAPIARATWLRVAAAALAVLGVAWWIVPRSPSGLTTRIAANGDPTRPIAANGDPSKVVQPSPELLASLPVLESWDLLQDDDLDLVLSGVDSKDELLLELSNDVGVDDASSSATPRKG